MSLENDRKEIRRQRREKQIAQAKRQQRKLLLAILGALVILALCLVLIITLRPQESALPGQTGDAAASTTTEPSTEPAETTVKETEPEETVITIAMAGDLNVSDALLAAAGSDGNYTDLFMDVVPLLSDADWTIVNFEGTVGNAPYGGTARRAPEEILTALRRGGVDMLQLANSYCVADGLRGFSSTIKSVKNAGLEPVGVFEDSSEYKKTGGFTLVDIKGVRVAFVAFTKGMDGMGLPAGSEDCVNILYKDYTTKYQNVDYEKIAQVMKNARAAEPDIIVVLPHWGSEYNDQISSTQKSMESFFLENGADVILGTHAHYLQEMKFENGKFVAFSLGDFAGDVQRDGTNYSVIVKVTIRKNNRTGVTTVEGYEYTPICTVEEADALRIRRLEQVIYAYEHRYVDRISKERYESLLYSRTRVEERIHPVEEN